MTCRRCEAQHDEGARFCEECGTYLEVTRPGCGPSVRAGKKFCRSCGVPLTRESGAFAFPEPHTSTRTDQPQNPRGDRRIARAVQFIQQHYRGKLTLQTVAREAGMGRFTLSHAFRVAVHMSLRTYLLRIRIAKATELLRGEVRHSVTDIAETDIAEMVGFGDLSRFNKAFKRCTGFSPTAYRKLREQEAPSVRDGRLLSYAP